MYQSILLLLLLMLTTLPCMIHSLHIAPTKSTELYVVPFPAFDGNDSDGSLVHPYSSLQEALNRIERDYRHGIPSSQRATIHLYPTHHFVNTLHFKQEHSHTRLSTMNAADVALCEKLVPPGYSHRRLRTASISGGILITNWTQVSSNTYSAVVPSLAFVNQLFINNQRIVRTRVPTNFSDYLYYAAPLNDSVQGRYGFQYQPGQFNYKSLADAMVVVYHSWTESHHYIDRLITSNNTVLCSNPSDRPIGTYVVQGQKRFHIENLCEVLIPNSFCFFNETKTIYLMTNGSYDPMKVEIITPVNEIVRSLASDDINNPVVDVTIDNIVIEHGAWNISRTQLADRAYAEYLTSAALFIDNATSIIISNVVISHTGSYGLRIREGTSNIIFVSSLVSDTGAGGVWIGDRSRAKPIIANTSKILSNEICYGGNVFPSAVGVLVHRADQVIIADNVIHHHRYDGISVGAQLGYTQAWTTNILVQGNYIYNIGMHILCDLGGIIAFGIQPGTIIHGNVVKNIFSYSEYMWGIYLDEGASEIVVSNNAVYNTGWGALFQHYGANNTIINNVFARASLIEPPHPNDPHPDGDVRVQNAENHTSWIYTHNIVYDTFQGSNHSAYNSDLNVRVVFNNNIYYNPYGTPLLFGHQQISFAEWKKTGQDNNSVITDPLFMGDVTECDFFTIQGNSPAARLGFMNLTKLSTWTPGCDAETIDDQFYHW